MRSKIGVGVKIGVEQTETQKPFKIPTKSIIKMFWFYCFDNVHEKSSFTHAECVWYRVMHTVTCVWVWCFPLFVLGWCKTSVLLKCTSFLDLALLSHWLIQVVAWINLKLCEICSVVPILQFSNCYWSWDMASTSPQSFCHLSAKMARILVAVCVYNKVHSRNACSVCF